MGLLFTFAVGDDMKSCRGDMPQVAWFLRVADISLSIPLSVTCGRWPTNRFDHARLRLENARSLDYAANTLASHTAVLATEKLVAEQAAVCTSPYEREYHVMVHVSHQR